MIVKTMDGEIEVGWSDVFHDPSYSGPGMRAGAARWLKIDGEWYRWDGTFTPLHEVIQSSELFTSQEIRQLLEGDLQKQQQEGV
jgi:hypothetical protein